MKPNIAQCSTGDRHAVEPPPPPVELASSERALRERLGLDQSGEAWPGETNQDSANQTEKHKNPLKSAAGRWCRGRQPAEPDRRITQLLLTHLVVGLAALWLSMAATGPQQVHGYNLDVQKALIKHGPKGSYFGYSLAPHVTFDPSNPNSTFRSSVLVGAPRAESSRAASLAGVSRPGAIYRCELGGSSTCQLLDVESAALSSSQTSSSSSSSSSFAPLNEQSQSNAAQDNPKPAARSNEAPPTGELLASAMQPQGRRDDQWLGVALASQGPNGLVVACAHRHVLAGPHFRWAQGLCYSLSSNLTFHRSWQPCLNRPVNKAHEEYGYCQAGTSADISESADLLLGAPGVLTWRGGVFANAANFGAKEDRTWRQTAARPDRYSYLGMSLVSGRFFNKQQGFASGAPRAHDAGQVLLLSRAAPAAEQGLRTEQVLEGEQLGSAFGYQLARLDFNGDGHQDLAVGAPFYFAKGVGGAVHLFASDGRSTMQPAGAKLTGKPESRFGFALANCGDLNRDNYEDLAVGAPSEQPGGAVYLYLGSAQGLRATPSQVVRASGLAPHLQLRSLGHSLAGGLDLDRNGYPDLLVGSYSDDAVLVLRGRPIIDLETRIEGNLSRIDPNRTSCEPQLASQSTSAPLPCFKFSACFSLDPAQLGDYSDELRLKYRIEAETFTGQRAHSRVTFGAAGDASSPQVVEREIAMDQPRVSRGNWSRCQEQRVYLRDRSDVHTPIHFKLTYSLFQPNAKYLAPTSTSAAPPPPLPILNQEEAQRVFAAKFLKDCGPNDLCESHLELEAQLAAPKETLGVNEVGYAHDKQVNLTLRLSNLNEPAYEAKLWVSHPPSLLYSGFKAAKQVSVVECVPVDKALVRCDLGNPMPKGHTKLAMIFNTNNQPGQFDFGLLLNTTSQNSKDARTSLDLSTHIRRKAELPPATRPPPLFPDTPTAEPPAWLIGASVLLGVLLFGALIYCLYLGGFFERPKTRYTQAATEDRL